jgi:DNA-binding FrmR family transcriptional regulator
MKQSKTALANKESAAACATDAKMAIAVDPERKAAAVRRLRRIGGQVRGLEAMVDQERYCADILVQIASVQEALRGVGRLLMRNHLEHCATMAIRDGGASATAMYDELLDLVYRHAR